MILIISIGKNSLDITLMHKLMILKLDKQIIDFYIVMNI